MCETFDGHDCSISLDGSETPKRTGYENLLSPEKNKVRKILHVCDSSFISDAAYHELAMQTNDLPSKTRVVSCRQEINSQYDIIRTPGMLPGSFLSLKDQLVKYIKQRDFSREELHTIKVKISGDGAKVSRVSNFIVMSFSIVDGGTSSHLDQQALAIVNCDENYFNLHISLRPLFDEINELKAAGHIMVGDTKYSLDLFVGGDMKFIQILLGLNSSIATYACPWCKVSKDRRGDISLPWDFYHSDGQFRTVAEIKSCAKSSKPVYGVKNYPLLDIEPDHYIPDELHLMMRVMDVLLRNCIMDSKPKDDYGKITGQSTDNVNLLVKAVQSCGVCFKTWLSKAGELEWTSLSGNDLKKVLKNLPDKLIFGLHDDTSDLVINLWKEFESIYSMITIKRNQSSDADTVFAAIHSFMAHFLDIGKKKREGYQPNNVTPYLHTLLYHVPYFLSKYDSLSQFTGQGVEKTNDIIKQIHQSKSNKLDATADALLTRKRLELGHQTKISREKRKYTKRDDHFWAVRKSKLTANKKARIEEEIKQADQLYNPQVAMSDDTLLENLNVEELKELIYKRTGKRSRFRNKDKLLKFLNDLN